MTTTPQKRSGTKLIRAIPPSLGTPNHLKRLLGAVATAHPKESELKEFLRRASLATPSQARTALRRIEDQKCTWTDALPDVASGSRCKSAVDQTKRGVASLKKTANPKGGKGK